MSVVSELNDRCRELTGGFIPDVSDSQEVIYHGCILIIQRKPENLSYHRVGLLGSTISVEHLRKLVCAGWQPDEINP